MLKKQHSMTNGRKAAWIPRALWLALMLLFAACSLGGPPAQHEHVGEAESAVFANGGFEIGAPGAAPPSWPVSLFLNPGITVQAPQTLAGLNLSPTIAGHAAPVALTTILFSAGGPLSQNDALLGAAATLRWPRFGNQCVLVNQNGRNQNVNSMAQTMTVAAGDVDLADGQVHVRFVVAPVLESPGHPAQQQPYFFVQATNVTQGNAVLYSNFNFSNQAGVPWKTVVAGGLTYVYTDWQLVDISPGSPALNMGDMVSLQIVAAGCSLGAHMGQLYVDGVGATVPGLFVSGSGPAQVNACNNITYKLTYQNGAATPAAGVNVTFNTPPGTTFQSINAPGLACVTPAVGAGGLITCTIGALPAGAGGSFTITVNVPCGTVGTVTAGNYSIQGTAIPPLLGPVVNTIVGCTLDSQCPAGNWCNETGNACTPTLANGTPIPSDPPHTGPTLNGTCTAAAATLVCTSGVCDTDNKCGFLNGDGPCTAGNAGKVCRSAVCDPDGKCGYANGDGPCTVASGPVVCRSGACSVNLLCEPAGGCNVDADCTGGNWCLESTHTCTPKLANGTAIPSDPTHSGPTLNGTCTSPAATLVCASGVCDTDNKCGFANGDGPCTAATGGTVCRSAVCDPDGKCGYANGDGPCTVASGPVVCRSGACSVNLLCEPAGGCNVDADCPAGNWCNEAAHTCTPKLANGMPVPTDAPHTNPTLDGTCTAAAGALTCVSGVCDTKDNDCGYADGDGPCTAASGPVVCRSGMCSTNGLCEPAGGCNVDADCPAGKWCNESMHACVPTLPNGTMVPTDGPHTNPTLNGTCTTAAGALTCTSGVCDTKDNECGYANGDGPCTPANGDVVCRSQKCGATGVCVGCVTNADCSGATPVCDTGKGVCVECTDASQCMGAKPVCDKTSETCVPCNGDNGGTTSDPCSTTTAPFCFLSGPMAGECGKCSTNADCAGHTGNLCDTGTGLCITGCLEDSDCAGSAQWCNEGTHTCTAKVANGMPVPKDASHTDPTLDGTCTAAAAMLTCVSGVCDPKDNQCGLADNDGPCSNNEQCRNNTCDPVSMTCKPASQCTTDADCKTTEFCRLSDHTCTPKLPIGQACDANTQCAGGDCSNKVCSGVIGSGNGLICAAGQPDRTGGNAPAGLFGLMLAAAALVRRRRA